MNKKWKKSIFQLLRLNARYFLTVALKHGFESFKEVTLPFAAIILLLKADESSDLPDLGPDPFYLLGKCEESLQLHFCIFEE